MKTLNDTIFYALFRLATIVYAYKSQCTLSLFVSAYLVLMVWFLPGYFIIDFIMLGALLLSPFIIKPETAKKGSSKYLWLSLVFLLFTFLTGVKTFYFLTLGTAMLFAIESIAGYLDHLPFFLLGLLSPTFKYFNNMLGFPVRLQLSQWAGKILQLLGYKIEVAGNVLILNGTEFSIDPACVGLKMMAASILAGLLVMAFFQQKRGKSFTFPVVTLILFSITGMNIISNLIRILLLTIFNILPDDSNHDIVGIICFLVYIILPSYFLIQYVARNNPNNSVETKYPSKGIGKPVLLNSLLFAGIILAGVSKLNHKEEFDTKIPAITLEGYSKQVVHGDIIKLEKPGILMYIKPMQHFYGAEHSPMICWVGSGYQFSRINKQNIEGKEFFTGMLKKGSDIIYAVWWFDDGSYQTTGQMDWRWRTLKGDSFNLVNVNSGNEKVLMTEIKRLLKY